MAQRETQLLRVYTGVGEYTSVCTVSSAVVAIDVRKLHFHNSKAYIVVCF